MSSQDRGKFIWYDLMTSDPKAAQDFYGRLIGWGTQDWEGGDQPTRCGPTRRRHSVE